MNTEKILREIIPSEQEKNEALSMYSEISEFIRETYGKRTILVGSVAKDTFLKEDKDLDIFIFFDKNVKRKTLEKEALEIGKNVFMHYKSGYRIDYAEHPYISGTIAEFNVEIVPCYAIDSTEKIISAVDRTPFHLTFVLNRLLEEQKNDVRLLKKFLKSQKMYGAEAKANGFSGYLCELLIIWYGSFESLIRAASEWPVGKIIDFNASDKGFDDPLVVIDPVDPNRNVASPVSLNTFSRFVLSCRKYLDSDDITMFYGPERGYTRAEGGRLVVIELLYDAFEDIFYAQCRRFMKTIEKACKAEGFTMFNCGIFSKGLFFDFEISKLPKCLKYRGPALGNIENIANFIQKNEEVLAEDGHLYAIKKRKHSDVIDLINDVINEKIGMGEQLKKADIKILLDDKAYNILKNEIIYF